MNVLMSMQSSEEGSRGPVTRQTANKRNQQPNEPLSSATREIPETVSQHPPGEQGSNDDGGKNQEVTIFNKKSEP